MAGMAAAAFAAAGVGTFFKDTISLASDAEQSLGGVEAVFKGYADTVISRSKAADRALGLSANSYRELSTLIGSQLKNAGVPMDELSGKTDGLISTGADLAAMFGGTTKDAVSAISSALKGEMDSIEKYGISLNASSLKAEALSMGLDGNVAAMDAHTKATVVMSLIAKQGGDALGAFGRESDTAAGRAQRAAAQWDNLKTTLGSKLLPVWSNLMDFVGTKVLPGLDAVGGAVGQVVGILFKGDFKGGPFAEDSALVNGLFTIREALEPIGAAAKQMFDILFRGDFNGGPLQEDSWLVDVMFDIREAFEKVVDFVRDHAQPILAGLGAALAVLVTPVIIGAIGALASVIGGALLSALTLLTSPIALIALGLGGLVAIFVQAYQESEPLRAAVEKLKDAFGVFFDAFDAANGAGGIGGFFDGLKAGLAAAWPLVKTALGEMGTALWSWIKDNIGPALDQLGQWLGAVVNWVGQTGLPWLVDTLLLLAGALIDWIGPMIVPALVKLGEFLGELIGWLWDTGLPWLWDTLLILGQRLVDWIGPQIVPMLAAIGEFLGELVGWLWDTGLPWLWDTLQDLAQALIDWILPQIPGILDKLGSFLGSVVGWLVGTGLPLLVGALLKLAWELVAWVLPRLPDLLTNFAEFIGSTVVWILTTGLPTLAKGLFSMAWEAIKSFWEAIEQSPLMQKLGDIFGSIVGIAKNVWTDVKNAFISGVNDVIGLINKFLDAVNAIAGKVGINLGLHVKPIGIDFGGAPTASGTSGGRAIALAAGGRVPGYSPNDKADNIPAMLTANEYVQPVDTTRHYGVGIMDAIRAKRIPKDVLQHYATGGLVDFGRRLQSMGAKVTEHPAFGGVAMGGHGKTSLHYSGHAIDVNTRPGTSALEQKELAPLAALARSQGFRTIFMAPDHYNHLHVDDGGGGSIGGAIKDFIQEALGSLAQKAVDPIKSGITSLTSGSPLLGMMGGATNLAIQSVVDAIKKKDEEESAAASGGGSFTGVAGAGVQQWAGTVSKALSMLGQPQSLIQTTLRRMQQESGGNARAVNNWDINAKRGTPSKGLLQVIDPTFRANAMPGYNKDIFDPLSNILASMRYAISRYGSLSAAYNKAGGYANGTMLASPGVHLVGERGPELVKFRGGEQVLTNRKTRSALASATETPLVRELHIHVGEGGTVKEGIEETMFQLRRIKRGGGIR